MTYRLTKPADVPTADFEASVLERAERILAGRLRRPGRALNSPAETRAFLRLRLATLEHEVFSVLFLDTRHRVIEVEDMFRGTIDGASVYPREVVKAALGYNAAAVIIAHNHPSGDPQPSTADRAITERLREALALIDVRMLDHVVVGAQGEFSFAEAGWL